MALMRIDAHQHFWNYDPKQYPWIPNGTPLQRDWQPADLEGEQAKVGLTGSIAVQARQTLEESRWLLRLAEQHPIIKGVVGWVDLRASNVEEQLAEFAEASLLLRPMPSLRRLDAPSRWVLRRTKKSDF